MLCNIWHSQLFVLVFVSIIIVLTVNNSAISNLVDYYSLVIILYGGENMKTVADLDRTDRRILNTLQRNGRIANVDLAREVNLTPTPCLERVKRLEKEGFITSYVALLDPVKANAALCAYIEVQLASTTTEAIQLFNQQMLSLSEVQECQMVAGGFDYLIKIRVEDMQHYQRFLGEKLSTIEGISQTHTYVVIEDVKSQTALKINL
jgi:Lrp/AsnC family transcriptional regulator, leucine-responsive regulatory protein